MGTARLRNKEAQVRFAVDGQDLEGSFLKVNDWEVQPQVDIVETEFTGEDRPDGDTNHKGFRGSFTIQELSPDVEQLIQSLEDRDLAHLPVPNISMSVFKLYRQPGAGDSTALYLDVILKCDSQRGEGSSYVNSRWSWFAPRRKKL